MAPATIARAIAISIIDAEACAVPLTFNFDNRPVDPNKAPAIIARASDADLTLLSSIKVKRYIAPTRKTIAVANDFKASAFNFNWNASKASATPSRLSAMDSPTESSKKLSITSPIKSP